MIDFAAARLNMVESQIRPNRVSDPRLLEAFDSVPRERFVPEALQGIAYIDQDLEVAPGRYLMEPRVLARLLQAAAPQPEDIVLDIGCATGYSTGILAQLAATVVALEHQAELAELGNAVLNDLGTDNAIVVEGSLVEGYAKQAPYDVILIGGAVAEIPEAIAAQLAEGGRLATVVEEAPGLGRATLMENHAGILSQRALFDAGTPLLPGFEKAAGFVF